MDDQQLLREAAHRLRSTELHVFNLHFGTLDGRYQYGIWLERNELDDDFREWLEIQLGMTVNDPRQLELGA